MANHHPPSLPFNPPFRTSTTTTKNPIFSKDPKVAIAEQLVIDIINPDLRENAIFELSKKWAQHHQDLALLVWYSCGTIPIIIQEIICIYPYLSPPTLTVMASNRVCNALTLLQCVASHPETRIPFISALMPMYLYPFLYNTNKTKPFEFLRLTSLGVIGALVKVDDTKVVEFLLSTEIIPLCLRSMELGTELSKTVATFILQKIILDDNGIRYICHEAGRFFAVCNVLESMLKSTSDQPSHRLLKHIIRCYLRLSDHPRACGALKTCLPEILMNGTFSRSLLEDPTTKEWLQELILNVSGRKQMPAFQAGGHDHMRANPARVL